MAILDLSMLDPTNPTGILGQLGALLSGQSAQAAPAAPVQQAPMPAPQQAPQPQPAPQAAPALFGSSGTPDMGDRLGAGFQGFTHAGSPMEALGNLFGGLTTGQRTDPQGMQQQALQATYQALRQSGVPDGTARAAALNPEVLKTVAGAYFDTKPVLQKTGTDPLSGQDSFSWVQPGQMKVTPAIQGGVALGAGGAPAGGQAAPATLQGVLDKIDQGKAAGLSQAELMQALPNSIRSGVDAMLNGKAIPSNLSMRGQARDLTLRFAHAIDPTFDETVIPQRTAFAHGMAQTTPSSPGGQKLLLNTAIQHVAEAGGAAASLGNSDGFLPSWMPGSSNLAHGINTVTNSAVSKSDKVGALATAAQNAAGEIGKLYSGNSGGGEAERLATMERFNGARTPQEYAAALEITRNMILDKLNSLQNQRDQVYGANGENVHPLIDPQTKVALDKIDTTIRALRGGAAAPAATAQTAAPAIKPLDVGGATTINGVTIKRVK
jgi:hypothetical protein